MVLALEKELVFVTPGDRVERGIGKITLVAFNAGMKQQLVEFFTGATLKRETRANLLGCWSLAYDHYLCIVGTVSRHDLISHRNDPCIL
jgi:hypothetical protein